MPMQLYETSCGVAPHRCGQVNTWAASSFIWSRNGRSSTGSTSDGKATVSHHLYMKISPKIRSLELSFATARAIQNLTIRFLELWETVIIIKNFLLHLRLQPYLQKFEAHGKRLPSPWQSWLVLASDSTLKFPSSQHSCGNDLLNKLL